MTTMAISLVVVAFECRGAFVEQRHGVRVEGGRGIGDPRAVLYARIGDAAERLGAARARSRAAAPGRLSTALDVAEVTRGFLRNILRARAHTGIKTLPTRIRGLGYCSITPGSRNFFK